MRDKTAALLIIIASFAFSASVAQAYEIKDIKVTGLQRISAGTVFNYMPVKVGDESDDSVSREIIDALFKTGFFKDISVDRDGDTLIVHVVERPSIDSITIEGNKEFDDDILKAAMKQVGLVEGRVFNRSVLDQTEREIKSQYFSIGRYSTEIVSTITPLERNRVAIKMDITEGDRARIKQINIVGNKSFKEKKLLKEFKLRPKSAFRFLGKADRYSKQQLAADLESLRSFYQDQGFLEFSIDSTQVSITPGKQDIYITVNITEGDKYTVSGYKLSGHTVIPQEELLALVTIKPGQAFSRRQVADSTKAISDKLADEGFAFANVNAVPEIDESGKTVSFTFFIDPGKRVYVRRVNISGNFVTRDEVIRREMRQLEGGWFSADKIKTSRLRLKRLGFFDDVNIETPQVPGSPDQVDVNVSVKERSTGTFSFGVGYSNNDGALFNASISYRNLFGTGKDLAVSYDNSKVNQVASIRYTDPYYTVDGVSRGFYFSQRRTDATQAKTAEYVSDTTGLGVTYKIPVSEFNSINLGAGFERIKLESTDETPPEFLGFITDHPGSDYFKATVGYVHDSRDSILLPTTGNFQRISLETGTGDIGYYRTRYQAAIFLPITRSLTFKLGGELGYADGFGDTPELPFFKNFFAGGASTVRGYNGRSLGPRDTGETPRPIGGDKRVLANMELFFPVPGAEKDSKSMRMGLFLDSGMVYGPDQNIDLGALRYAAGVSFNWFSPVGPISISYGVPLNEEEDDEVERFQFTLGGTLR
ncbi:MAG: outer membrane protein assembly factor BamA [Gammaproteobacteria bacterium]|nr:MAG: outer membrane protein assembly factor BamA [Gammaproteobacteria bacterium]